MMNMDLASTADTRCERDMHRDTPSPPLLRTPCLFQWEPHIPPGYHLVV